MFGPMDFLFELTPGAPKRAQLERALREGIRSGRLRPGSRLPATRTLALELGLSRGVVVEAYSQLTAEGYLVGGRGAGTRVTEVATALAAVAPRPLARPFPVRYEMRSGVPDPAGFPRRQWQAATARALRELPDVDLLGPHRGGLARLRTALADYIGRARAAAAVPEQVVVTAGLAQGLALVMATLKERGVSRVAVEDPSWPHHARAVRLGGLEAVPVAVDEDGLAVAELDGLGVGAVITTPAHQFPTGVVLAPERRAKLVEWARRTGSLIIEDDYDSEYRYDRDPVAALQGLAPERVVYAGTVSKTLAPTLRIGWLLLPESLAEDVAHRGHAGGAWPSVIEQAALAVMLERGELERHLRSMRRRYRTRRDALADALRDKLDVRIGATAAGLHLIAWLPDASDEDAIAGQALARGVALDTLHRRCWVHAPRQPALLLGYAALSEHALRLAVGDLASLPALQRARRPER
jgi:GntR family transcriptional regulator / MocR family aminotransferase